MAAKVSSVIAALTPGQLSAIIAAMRPWQIVELALLLAPGMLLLWRVRRCREEERPRPSSPPFSVIVPARNEESVLPALLASLALQSVEPAEIIVVDDGSTDATAAIAAGAGCRVIRAGRPPRGWLGKTWACWVGARNAASELLLFLDADTRLEPQGCRRMLAERIAARRGGDDPTLARDRPLRGEAVVPLQYRCDGRDQLLRRIRSGARAGRLFRPLHSLQPNRIPPRRRPSRRARKHSGGHRSGQAFPCRKDPRPLLRRQRRDQLQDVPGRSCAAN